MGAKDRLSDVSAGHLAVERAKQLELDQLPHRVGSLTAVLSLGMLRHAWRRLWTAPLVTPAGGVPRPAPGVVALSWIGHATVMLTTSSRIRLLVDPFLVNWLGGLRRARAATIAPGDLAEVDLVLISSVRADRLSRRSLARISRTATVVVPAGCGARLAGLNFARVMELGVGNSFEVEDMKITSVPAHPWRPTRAACGYVVRTQGRAIYFAGETGYFPGFAAIAARHAPDVAVLPIAGYRPDAFRRGRLSPLDALYAFEDLRARQLVPVGFGSFALGYEPLGEPEAWLRELVRQRRCESGVRILAHGETLLLR